MPCEMQPVANGVRLRRARPEQCVVNTESNESLLGDIPDRTLTPDRGALRRAARRIDPEAVPRRRGVRMKQVFTGGERITPRNEETIPVIAPADGIGFDEIARGGAHEIDLAVAGARKARSGRWGRMTATERGRILASIGQRILDEVTRAIVPVWRAAGNGGVMLNVGSTAGVRPRPGMWWYNASKDGRPPVEVARRRARS